MSKQTGVRYRRGAGHLHKKMAIGLASLYDPSKSSLMLDSPLRKATLEVVPPTYSMKVDSDGLSCHEESLAPPNPTDQNMAASPSHLTESEANALSPPSPADNMEVDKANEESASRVRNEWIGTSQFFVDQNVEIQQVVSRSFILS
jgi:hypothetical protein